MFDIFAAVFDRTLFVMRYTPASPHPLVQLVSATVHTALRAAVVYVAIRVVLTAVSHGPF